MKAPAPFLDGYATAIRLLDQLNYYMNCHQKTLQHNYSRSGEMKLLADKYDILNGSDRVPVLFRFCSRSCVPKILFD